MGMKAKKIYGWHFTDGMKLRDGQPLVFGKVYKHKGPLRMCQAGYHASVDIQDALSYAPGFFVSRVECSGDVKEQSDKLICRQRKVLWGLDAKKIILGWSIRVVMDAVKTAKKIYKDKAWNVWADLWISDKDRTFAAAYITAVAVAAHAADTTAFAAAAAAREKYSGWLVKAIEKAHARATA